MTSLTQQADQFRALHHGDTPLLLANVWDPLSAAIVAEAGLPAVATASAAVALSRGYDDGEQVPFDELVQLVERISKAVDVPISVDFESGYGETANDVRTNTLRLIAAGAVGVNIEDSIDHDTLRSIDEQCERIQAVQEAGKQQGVPIFINARTDVFMMSGEENEGIRRLEAYAEAGAGGVYPIMCEDLDTLGRIHAATQRPINVFLTTSLPPLEQLLDVGVRRISMGPGLLGLAAGATREAVRRLTESDLQLDRLARMTTSEMRRLLDIAT